jgi:hypothetical protein
VEVVVMDQIDAIWMGKLPKWMPDVFHAREADSVQKQELGAKEYMKLHVQKSCKAKIEMMSIE